MNRILGHLSNLTLILSGLFLFAMMVHVTVDVALRYAMNSPIPGTLEIVSAYYMVAGVFLPLAAVELARASIAVDAAYQCRPPQGRGKRGRGRAPSPSGRAGSSCLSASSWQALSASSISISFSQTRRCAGSS